MIWRYNLIRNLKNDIIIKSGQNLRIKLLENYTASNKLEEDTNLKGKQEIHAYIVEEEGHFYIRIYNASRKPKNIKMT